MKNLENFREAPKGSTQEEFERLVTEDIEKRKKTKKEKPNNNVEFSDNSKDKEELFEGVEPKKEKVEEKDKKDDFDIKKGTQRLEEIEDILKAQEGLRAADPEDRAKMIGSFKREELKKERALILEDLEKNKIADLQDIRREDKKEINTEPPAPLRKRGRPRKEDKEETEKKSKEWDKEDGDNEEIKKYREDINKKVAEKVKESKKNKKEDLKEEKEIISADEIEAEEINTERREAGILDKEEVKNKIEEIKKVINKEFGGEAKEPKTQEEKLILAEKSLNITKNTAKDREEDIKKNRDEFNSLFKSENVMSNFINKIWWESDKHDQLNNDFNSLTNELEQIKKEEKGLESEIKIIKKDIQEKKVKDTQEKKFQEGREKSKVSKKEEGAVTDEESKEKLDRLKMESRKEELKNDLDKMDFKIEEVQKEKELLDKIKETPGSKDVSKGIEKKNEELKKLTDDKKRAENDYYSLFTLKEIEDEMDGLNKKLEGLDKKGFTEKEIAKKAKILNEKMDVLGEAMGNLIK